MRKTGRAFALIVAVCVCLLPVFSFQASAATVAVDINAAIDLSVEVRYTDDSYTLANVGNIGRTPFDEPADDYSSGAPAVNRKPVQFVRVQTDLTGYVTGKLVQLHVVYRLVTSNAKSSLAFIGVNSATRNGGTWTSLPYTIVSSQYGQDPATGSAYMDAIIEFTVPVESEILRVYGTFNTNPFTPQNLGDIVGGVQTCEFMYLNSVTDQDAADRDEANRIEGSVTDKTEQSNQITNQIEQLQKPNVDSSSGKPVVGGLVVDPLSPVDQESFASYTNVIGTIFGSGHILSMFIISFSMIFISYVLFGKTG